MKISFDGFAKTGPLIDKLSKIKVLTLDDYGKAYQPYITFLSTALELRIFHGNTSNFESIVDFIMHIFSIPYARGNHFELTVDFFEQELNLESLDLQEFLKYINSSVESFFEGMYLISGGGDIWKLSLNIKGFIEGYKIVTVGSDQIFVCRTSEYYLYFSSQSIN